MRRPNSLSQLQFPGMGPGTYADDRDPGDMRPDEWSRRPDVYFHGTQVGGDWPGEPYGSDDIKGTVHLGTYAAAVDRLVDVHGDNDDAEGWIHARRVPDEDLDEETFSDPHGREAESASDWVDWAHEYGHHVERVVPSSETDDADPDFPITEDYLDDSTAARRTREAAIAAVGKGVRYKNEFEHKGSHSVEVPPSVPRTWAQDVADASNPHPNYVSAAQRSRPAVEYWSDELNDTVPQGYEQRLPMRSGLQTHADWEPTQVRVNPHRDPGERGRRLLFPNTRYYLDQREPATFRREINERRWVP